jgi:hypothetical protein
MRRTPFPLLKTRNVRAAVEAAGAGFKTKVVTQLLWDIICSLSEDKVTKAVTMRDYPRMESHRVASGKNIKPRHFAWVTAAVSFTIVSWGWSWCKKKGRSSVG